MDNLNTNETVELTDLEPMGEVKGGASGGTSLPSAPVVDLQFNQQNDTLASRNEHPKSGLVINHNETTADDEDLTPLIDLEPNSEVVGGAGFGYAVLTVGGATNLNQGTERTSNLTYSGESGGLNG